MARDVRARLSRNAFYTFMVAVETGSIRKAAEVLGIAQSAVSRQIRTIEEELHARLLERLPNGIALTAAGEIFLRHAREDRAQLERVRSEISTLRGLRDAEIRVAIVESFATQLLPACIGAFLKKHPGVTHQVFVDVTGPVVKLVRDGFSDLGITYNLPLERDLEILHSIRDPMVAVMRPSHPLAGRGQLTLLDLAAENLALPAIGSPIRGDIDRLARTVGISFKPILETSSVPMMLEISKLSDTIAIISRMAAADSLRHGTSVMVPIPEEVFNLRRIDIFSVSGWPLTAAAETFARFVEQQLHALLPQPSGHASPRPKGGIRSERTG